MLDQENKIVEKEEIGKIAEALAKAQEEMGNPYFDSENPYFKSKYASLAAIRNASIPVLAKNGIAVIQILKTCENGVACKTSLLHKSGEMIEGNFLLMPAAKLDAQGLGSAATYARRYSLQALVGIVGDSDDDANEATHQNGKPAAELPKSKPQPTKPTVAQPQKKEITPGTKTAITRVQEITQQPTKGKNPLLKILGKDNVLYMTFSKSLANIAKSAQEAGLPVEIKYTESKYGNQIEDGGISIMESKLNPDDLGGVL